MKFVRRIMPMLMLGSGLMAADRPPVMLIAGQSREEFVDYLEHVSQSGQACPRPAGAAFYTSLDLNGVTSPHANAPGDNHQDLPFLQLVQDPLVFQIGLWLGRDQLQPIAEGQFDHHIDRLTAHLIALRRPVYVRIGYEFDGPHNRYPPAVFVSAYRRIARGLRAGADIILVWHSYAMQPTYQERPIEEWYPGDDWVDWIGLSFFQVTEEGYHAAPHRERVVAFARAHRKPVLIGEASAIRYTSTQKTLSGRAYWNYWYQPFFDFIMRHPEIRAVSIIDVNWDSQAQHRELEWGDARLEGDPYVLQRWREMAGQSWWVPADDNLYPWVRSLVTTRTP